jgi:cyanobactin maturation PatA/PatG family protease
MTQSPQFVYVLGQLGFDFGTEARRDGFTQAMEEPSRGVASNPQDPRQLLAYLQQNPWDAASLIWTLSIEATPIYAVFPAGPYAAAAHERLRHFLGEQLTAGVERVSIPGVLAGSVRLANGQVLPAVVPEVRGMYSWSTAELVKAVARAEPAEQAGKAGYQEKILGIHNFLDRVYFELRNLGQTPQEQATNFAATNAFNIERVYEQAMKEKMDLDTIEVDRSPVCRPESDCWDVKLMFFFPDRQVQTVRRAYRFTVDVSDVVPVTVGTVRSWYVR